jgi:sarcosine oxidase
MTASEHLVVGAGLAGAAAAWRLAQRGRAVTIVERRTPAAPDGSSHGSARIFRYAYAEPRWAAMVAASLPGWRELEAVHGAPLLTPTGALDLGTGRAPAGLAAVLSEVGVEHELVAREDARDRWPQFAVDSDVLHHPGGGVLDAEAAVGAMVAATR